MRIFLLGYMGCGKTTLGRKIASEYYFRFIDLDEYIESKHGNTISEIFAQEGEDTFRKYEREALEDMLLEEDVIVATGGGAPCFFDNMERIKANSVSVYIQMDAEQIAKRLKHSKVDRPLLKGKSEIELYEFIKKTLESRSQFYNRADIIFENNNISVKEALSQLSKQLKIHL